jgi:hypothetical protein
VRAAAVRVGKPTPQPSSTAKFYRHLADLWTHRRSSRDRRTSHACRSAAGGSFYLVLFAPASSEQAFCSLECEFSQVEIDCVSEADIFLLMQAQ